jgi:hypothetical protein
LLLFKTLWGWTESLEQACSSAEGERFDGLEVIILVLSLFSLKGSDVASPMQNSI